jgi:Pyruvate/2-oxoacid:ferredoxin oxidoreductase delta subunit
MTLSSQSSSAASSSADSAHVAHRILVCACAGSELTPREKVETFLKGFSPPDAEVVAVPDLCRIAAKDKAKLAEYADADKLTVVACFPRTVRSLFQFAEVDVDDNALEVHNLRKDDPEAIRALIEADCCSEVPAAPISEFEPIDPNLTANQDGWAPWFPVIDQDRCTHCRQCLSFCLFGVYETDEAGKVHVANPEECKTGCPACARICPEVALIFPKYPNSPVNGDEITNIDEDRERVRVDMQQLLGDNLYAALAERKRARRRRVLLRKQREDSNAPSGQPDPNSKGTSL